MSNRWASWNREDAVPNKSPMVQNEIQCHEISSDQDLRSTLLCSRDVDDSRLTWNRENANPNKRPMVQNKIPYQSQSQDLVSTSQCIIDIDDRRLEASQLEPKIELNLSSTVIQLETNASSEAAASNRFCGIHGPFDMTDPFERYRLHPQTSIIDQNMRFSSMDEFSSNSTESSYSEIMDKHSGLEFQKLQKNLRDEFLKCVSKGNEACFCPSTTPPDSTGNDAHASQLDLRSDEMENHALKNVVPQESPPQKLLSDPCLVSRPHNKRRSRLAINFLRERNCNDDSGDSGDRGRSADEDVQVDGSLCVSSRDSTCTEFRATAVPIFGALDRNPAGMLSDQWNENTDEQGRDGRSMISTSSKKTEGSVSSLPTFEEVAEPLMRDSTTAIMLSGQWKNTDEQEKDVKSIISTSSNRTLGTEGSMSSLPTLEEVDEPLMPDSTTSAALDKNPAGMLSDKWNENTDEQGSDVRSNVLTSSKKTEGSMSSLPTLEAVDESLPDSTSSAALDAQPARMISGQRTLSTTPVEIEDIDDHSGQFQQHGQDVARSQRPQSMALMTLATNNAWSTLDIRHSNNVQAVGTFCYIGNAKTIHRDNVKDHSKEELANNEKVFVETDACEDAASILESTGILFICHSPSTGKASLGKHLLSKYQKEGFEPVILTSLAQILAEIKPKKKQAILVTNVFGAYSFNEAMIENFKRAFHRVDQCDDTKKFIFTSSNAIFSRGLPFLKLTIRFSENQVLDLSSKSLSSITKRSLLLRHLEIKGVNHKVLENLIEKIVDCESTPIFPTCCRLFASSPHLHDEESTAAVEFFEEPVHYHVHYIQCLSEGGDKIGFAALFLTMSLEGLPKCLLLEDSPVHVRAKKYLDLLGHHPNPTFASIIKSAESLVGTYLVEDEICFSFLHPFLYDAVACVLGKSQVKILMEICSVDFLLNRVFVEDHSSVESNTRIILERKYFPFLSQRFIGEIKSGNLSLVITHSAFSNENFFRDFVEFCKKNHEVESVLESTDRSHPIIYWASWACNEYMFKWAVREQHVQKKKMPNELIRKVAKACCISGNLATLEVVSRVIKSFPKIVTDVRKTELPVPTYVVSGEKLLHRSTELVTMGSLLHTASFYGHLPIVKFLIGYSRVDLADEDGNMPINLAAKQGHADTVIFLIEKGAKIRTNRTTVMADACEAGRTEVVEVLLGNRARKLLQVQGPEPRMTFPIHLAVLSRNPKLVKLLLNHGANPDVEDASMNTAFHAACTKGSLSVLKALKPTSEQLNKENKKGNRCLHLACELTETAMVHYLIHNGSDVDALNKIQQMPLHVAAKNNHKSVVELLISKDANAYARDIKGRTPLSLTTRKCISDILKEYVSKHS